MDFVFDRGSSILTAPDLVPARMLNEYAYCPRLCWLVWVEAVFADSYNANATQALGKPCRFVERHAIVV